MTEDNPLASCRILALDDHAIQVKIFQKILETNGYTQVTGISDPLQCLPLHHENPFDLVIVDLDMPNLNGFGVIQQLKEEAENDFLPIIVVTGSDEKQDMLRALKLGARDFVTRPVHREELVHRVNHLLRIRLAYKKVPTALRPRLARIDERALRMGRILVVEDDAAQRVIIEKLLKMGNYSDVSGLSDPGVLRSFMASQSAPFEVVILDLHLPGLSTREAIEVIHEMTPGKNKPYILAITSDDSNEVRWDAFRDGAVDILHKPLDREIFLARMDNLIELRLLV
ncbi:MAG: response regulator [Magnetococcales bacterium]|nr:response regulator [Magnetococcales bacterium]NGZ25788.1 response regulator [Magnetococcales bacterium]